MFREIQGVKKDYDPVAMTLGFSLSHGIYIDKVVFKTALRKSIPQLLTLVISTVHMSMFISLIGGDDLLRQVLRANARDPDPIALFTLMGAFYCMICVPLFLLGEYIKKKNQVYDNVISR